MCPACKATVVAPLPGSIDLGIDLGIATNSAVTPESPVNYRVALPPSPRRASSSSPRDDLARLSARVDQLGRANSRLTLAAIVGPVLAAIVGVLYPTRWAAPVETVVVPAPARATAPAPAPSPAKAPLTGIIEARGLVIRDEAGRIRATLGYDGPKAVGLKLFEGGVLRSEYRVWDNGVPSLGFNYFAGGEAINIGGGGTIEPSLDMFDIEGLARVQFSLHDGQPNLSLHHSKVRTRFQLGVHPGGVPYMDFFDGKDKILPMLTEAGVPIR